MKKIILKLIRLYQKTLSLDHGPLSFLYSEGYCRFRPTCSEYTYQAINKYGLLIGGFLGFWRINRCNPLNKGGYDEVPLPSEISRLASYGFVIFILYISLLYILALVLRRIL